jgi:hypothetical protein
MNAHVQQLRSSPTPHIQASSMRRCAPQLSACAHGHAHSCTHAFMRCIEVESMPASDGLAPACQVHPADRSLTTVEDCSVFAHSLDDLPRRFQRAQSRCAWALQLPTRVVAVAEAAPPSQTCSRPCLVTRACARNAPKSSSESICTPAHSCAVFVVLSSTPLVEWICASLSSVPFSRALLQAAIVHAL